MRRRTRENLACLRTLARGRRGRTFTLEDALRFGISRKTIAKLASDPDGSARIARFDRGIYQVIPDRAEDHVIAAWRKVGEDAIASHRTALALHNLSDIEPRGYEFTVPRSRRSRSYGERFKIHTTTSRPKVVSVHGVPVTSVTRTIVDCALLGEQTEIAIAQAFARGLTTEAELREEARLRARAVRDAIERAIAVRDSYAAYI